MAEPFIPLVEEDQAPKVLTNPDVFIPKAFATSISDTSPQAQIMQSVGQSRLIGDRAYAQDRSPRSGIGVSALEGIARGDDTFDQQIEILAQTMFPDIYKINRGLAIQRFGRDGRTGDIVFQDLDGKVRPVTPNITGAETLGEGIYRTGMNVARGLTGNIEEAAGVPAEITTSVLTKSPMAGAAAGGVAASTASAGRKVLVDYLTEQSRGGTFDFTRSLEKMDKLDVATDGALYSFMSLPGMMIGKMVEKLGGLNRLRAPRPSSTQLQTPTPEGPTPAELGAEAMQTAREKGRTLTVGQATGDESLLVMERVLARFPENANKFSQIYEKQLDEVQEELTKKLLPRLNDFKDDLSEGAVFAMSETAKEIVKKAEQARTAATNPLYLEAFNSGVRPDATKILSLINQKLKTAAKGGASHRALLKVKKSLQQEQPDNTIIGPAIVDDYKVLHDAKINLDAQIEDIVDGVEGSAGRTSLANLEIIRAQLASLLRRAHPKYDEGADLFQQLTIPIEKMKRGAIGVLTRMNATDVNPARQLARVFNAFQVSSPKVIEKLRADFKGANKIRIFNAGFRAYLQSVFEEVARRTAREKGAAALASFAGNMYNQVFKTPGAREAFKAGVGSRKTYQDFASFFNHLSKLSQTKVAGSQTSTDLPIIEKMLEGAGSKAVGTAAKLGVNLPVRLADWFRGLSISNRASKLADLYTTPAGQDALRQFRAIKPGTQASINALTKVALFMGYDATLRKTSDRYGGDIQIDGQPAREAR